MIALARQIWRGLLPAPLRRLAQPLANGVLEAHVRRQARRPHQAGRLDGPIRVVGFLSGSHGIAASARLAIRAFKALGIEVEAVDVAEARLAWNSRDKAPLKPGPWIFHLNAPELLAAMAYLGPERVQGPRYGYWAWELPRAPAAWLKDAALIDEVWAPSAYTARAFEGAQAGVRVVPHPLFMEDYLGTIPAPRDPGFLAVSLFDFRSSMARKNPQGSIAAFRLAFGADPSARLIIKTQNGEHAPEALAELKALAGDNIQIIDAVWPYERIKALIASADVLISLHRAEGFGLTLAEAMALGTAVIATAGSGNQDFMDETCARLVPSRPIPVEDPQGIYRGQTWADPDVTAAAAALRALRDDPDLGPRLAIEARHRVANQLSPEAWFRTLPEALQQAARHRA